jgi:ribose-phosphate pyrophosphokinase
MMPIFLALPGNEEMTRSLAETLPGELGTAELRRFPDGENYARIDSAVSGKSVVLVCTLDRPDDKFLRLSFMARTARELGASEVGLVCPYLAYMRQDQRFRPGEAISSVHFGALLSTEFDWLVTVDPHLHRYHSLKEIFSITARPAHAAPALAAWISENVSEPVLIGPDSESAQWASSVATRAAAPHVVLEKLRRGDRDVGLSVPNLDAYAHRTPVLVDDVISTGQTMIETIRRLGPLFRRAPVCVGVHGIFADDSFAKLQAAGASRIVTSNTIPHESNQIDVSPMIVDALLELKQSNAVR